MRHREPHWDTLETWLVVAFAGQLRKNGLDRVVDHSIRVGRSLRRDGEDDITVVGGYCHDVLEDVDDFKVLTPEERRARLFPVAFAALRSEPDAIAAVLLAEACCYSDAEYLLPKADRKASACARWLASDDIRLLLVKQADVDDNDADCDSVSVEFAESYRSWAIPLRTGLCERISTIRGGSTNTP